MKRFVFYLVLFSIALLLIEYDDCSEVYAAGTGISVNNYAQEPEKAFTAEDLRRILDKSLSVNKTEDKDKKESSEKSNSETENDRENDCRKQRLDNGPCRAENRLLIQGRKVSLDKQEDQIPILEGLFYMQVKQLVLGCDTYFKLGFLCHVSSS